MGIGEQILLDCCHSLQPEKGLYPACAYPCGVQSGSLEEIAMSAVVRETHAAYQRLRRFVPLGVLRSEKDYRKAMAILDEIIDEIGQDEAHPLADLAEALALFIHSYEETHAKLHEATGPEVLRSLMEEHGLTQSELPEIGSQGVVSEILSGERELNIRQSAIWLNDSESPLPSLSETQPGSL
jgi:HTH-type transcriptional regulator/antitoxin HigA